MLIMYGIYSEASLIEDEVGDKTINMSVSVNGSVLI